MSEWGSGRQGCTFQMQGSGRDARYASKSSSLPVGASATAARLTCRRRVCYVSSPNQWACVSVLTHSDTGNPVIDAEPMRNNKASWCLLQNLLVSACLTLQHAKHK